MKTSSTNLTSRERLEDATLRFANQLLRPAAAAPLPHPATVDRIAILKPCCLGDMLMATPVIRALSQHFPSAEIVVLTGEWTKGAIEGNPRIRAVVDYPDGNTFSTLLRLTSRLRDLRIDLAVALDRSPVPALAMRLAGIRFRVGIDNRSRGLGLTHRIYPESDQHETEIYLTVIESIGIDSDDGTPEYFIPSDAHQRIEQLIPKGLASSPLIVVHPGGAVNPGVAMLEKRWPATSYGELVSLLVREAGGSVVLVGSETDQNAVNTVRDFARAPLVDLCGQLDLDELAALCQRASLYVGNDSGTTHLASAVGTPVVAIFGPTSPRRYRPLGRNVLVCAPPESWNLNDGVDLRSVERRTLPDISQVPLPQVFNACLEQLGGAR